MSTPPGRNKHRRHWPALRDPRLWLLVAALLLALVAWSGPGITVLMPRSDVLMVVDLTGSMNVRDVHVDGQPASRLEQAKAAMLRLLTTLPCGSRVGLGIFSERRSFILFEPIDACANYAPLAGSIAALNWRMAWEGDSRIARGLFDAAHMAQALEVNLIFLTDGHEAPPLPASGKPPFTGTPGEIGGLVVGVGGHVPTPIPKFDEDGYEIGTWEEHDVPQVNRVGQSLAAGLITHPNADDASAPAEHLSSVREAYLRELAQDVGLAYRYLDRSDALAPALLEVAHLRHEPGRLDLTWPLAALAWLLVASAYLWPLITAALARLTWRRNHAGAQHRAASSPFPHPPTEVYMKSWNAFFGLALATSALLPAVLLAHGPSPRRCNETVAVNASVDRIWERLAEPCALANWHPSVSACTAEGQDMQLTLKNGGSLSFQIDELDADSHTVYYRFGDGIALETFPVSSLTGRIQIEADGSGSKVHWAATFYRFDTHNDPEPGEDDEAAREAVEAFVKAGLNGLVAANQGDTPSF